MKKNKHGWTSIFTKLSQPLDLMFYSNNYKTHDTSRKIIRLEILDGFHTKIPSKCGPKRSKKQMSRIAKHLQQQRAPPTEKPQEINSLEVDTVKSCQVESHLLRTTPEKLSTPFFGYIYSNHHLCKVIKLFARFNLPTARIPASSVDRFEFQVHQ